MAEKKNQRVGRGRLADKVCLITGTAGAVGQGSAAARLFAQEGAKLVGTDIRKEGEALMEEIRAEGGEAAFCTADLTREGDVKALVQFAVKKYGRLDVLYNNAARGAKKPFLELSKEEWDYTIENELNLVFLMCKHGIPEMIKAGGGSIINTSSAIALRANPFIWGTVHAAAKAAVIGLTRQLALEFADKHIRANVICPGTIATSKSSFDRRDDEYRQKRINETLVGRVGTPEDIAKLALYLASDESSFVTGAVFVADGGATARTCVTY
ncbi:MAG: SDR family NAD(P)-dependent oxidoreductase [Thermodesulfobacteriota bacterium]